MSAFAARLQKALTHRWFPWFLGLVAGVVHLPSLSAGFIVDDHAHRWFAQGNTLPGGPRGSWELYRFADGGPGVGQAVETGVHAWWTAPDLKLAFFRPITSLLRVAEEAAFGDQAWLCHVVSILLFVATALAVWRLLALWVGGAAGNLAALLFAIDDAHAMPVTWIAARHAVIGTLFLAWALALFLRARREGRVAWPAGLLFFAALSSSESALGGLAFFVALALAYGSSALGSRVRALLPAGAATLVWLIVYVAFDYGAKGSAYYVDPLASPAAFTKVAVTRAPTLALAQLYGIPAEISGMVPGTAPTLALLGALGFAVCAWLSLAKLPNRAQTLSLLAAFVLSIVPACGTNADDRLLMVPGIAAFGLIGCWARYVAHAPPSFGLRVATAGGMLVHVLMALALLPARSTSSAKMLTGFVARGSDTLPVPEPGNVETMAISAPDGLLPSGMVLRRHLAGNATLPLRVLSTAPASTLTLSRPALQVLELASEKGMMHDPFVAAVRADPFRAGDRRVVRGIQIEVLAAEQGYPTKLRFTFTTGALEDGTTRFVTWRNHRFEEIELPRVGEALELPALDFAQELAAF